MPNGVPATLNAAIFSSLESSHLIRRHILPSNWPASLLQPSPSARGHEDALLPSITSQGMTQQQGQPRFRWEQVLLCSHWEMLTQFLWAQTLFLESPLLTSRARIWGITVLPCSNGRFNCLPHQTFKKVTKWSNKRFIFLLSLTQRCQMTKLWIAEEKTKNKMTWWNHNAHCLHLKSQRSHLQVIKLTPPWLIALLSNRLIYKICNYSLTLHRAHRSSSRLLYYHYFFKFMHSFNEIAMTKVWKQQVTNEPNNQVTVTGPYIPPQQTYTSWTSLPSCGQEVTISPLIFQGTSQHTEEVTFSRPRDHSSLPGI